MSLHERIESEVDVIVAGARAAGASTAMLLARRGLRVLVVDPSPAGSDTVSTHALVRGGVTQLARWGLLDEIVTAGASPVRHTRFLYEDGAVDVDIEPRDGVDALYAPRRTLLDATLARAAARAGATVVHGARVAGLLRDSEGTVRGARIADGAGEPVVVRAGLVIGADGIRSPVAREVSAPLLHEGRHAAGVVYGYWPGLAADGYQWYFPRGVSAGVIPTDGGLTCVFLAMPPERLRDERVKGLDRLFARVLAEAAPSLSRAIDPGAREGALRTFGGVPGFLRRPYGPGWALVGDAGFFRDPITAHGLTDALRDATLLADAVIDGGEAAYRSYGERRDALAIELLDISDEVAGFEWSVARIRELHLAFSKVMSRENRLLREIAGRSPGPREAGAGSPVRAASTGPGVPAPIPGASETAGL